MTNAPETDPAVNFSETVAGEVQYLIHQLAILGFVPIIQEMLYRKEMMPLSRLGLLDSLINLVLVW